jgi:hypothetical protein
MICDALCTATLPTAYGDCKKAKRKAGIKYIGVMDCHTSIDLTDIVDVAAAVTAGTIVGLPLGIGSKPLPSSDKKKYESCQVDFPIGTYTHTLAFKTYYIDSVTATDYAFFNNVIKNSPLYRFFWVDCNGQIFYNPDYTTGSTTIHSGIDAIVDGGLMVGEDGTKDNQVYELTLSFINDNPVIVGHVVAGIEAALGI